MMRLMGMGGLEFSVEGLEFSVEGLEFSVEAPLRLPPWGGGFWGESLEFGIYSPRPLERGRG